MGDDDSVDEVMEIADSPAPLLDRVDALLAMLRRRTSHDAAWLTLCDPRLGAHVLMGAAGLDETVSATLHHAVTSAGPRARDLCSQVDPLLWERHLAPAGFRGGAGVTLRDGAGRPIGFLGLLHRGRADPCPGVHRLLDELAPHVARGVSPVRSLLATARMVPDATAGVALADDGTLHPLPGTGSHPLLRSGSPAVGVALGYRPALRHVARSFLWPSDEPEDGGHVRLTVLATPDVSSFVTGLLLLGPHVDRHALTPRELEVLGLLVSGRSNQQIAHRLAVTSRTVATHVEHVMRKLHAPSRTLAAVRAEREGLFVPPAPRGR